MYGYIQIRQKYFSLYMAWMKQIKFICIYTRTWAVYLKIIHLSANIFRMSNILLLIVVFQLKNIHVASYQSIKRWFGGIFLFQLLMLFRKLFIIVFFTDGFFWINDRTDCTCIFSSAKKMSHINICTVGHFWFVTSTIF